MLVKFYMKPVQTRTDDDGLPYYESVPHVRITRDPTNTVDRKAKDEDQERFPAAWAFFKKQYGDKEAHDGLVLEMWPMISEADTLNLKARDIYTVQELAAFDAKKAPPHVGVLVKLAKDYVKVAGNASKTSDKVNELIETIEALEEENKGLKETIARLETAAA